MSTALDLASAVAAPAGVNAWPDDIADGYARVARLDRLREQVAFDARFFTAAACWDWHLSDACVLAATTVVSELVTNAVRHANWPQGRTTLSVTLRLSERCLSIEVADPDPGLPLPATEALDGAQVVDADSAAGLSGMGLSLVVPGFAESWHAEPTATGKTVRALIRLAAGGTS